MKKAYLCNSFLLILAEKRERFAQISVDNALLWIVIATEGKMITSGLLEVYFSVDRKNNLFSEKNKPVPKMYVPVSCAFQGSGKSLHPRCWQTAQ